MGLSVEDLLMIDLKSLPVYFKDLFFNCNDRPITPVNVTNPTPERPLGKVDEEIESFLSEKSTPILQIPDKIYDQTSEFKTKSSDNGTVREPSRSTPMPGVLGVRNLGERRI